MRVLVTGASGFIGTQLCQYLSDRGHDIVTVTRHSGNADGFQVADIRRGLPSEALVGVETVVHLAAIAHRRGGSAIDFNEVNRDAAILVANQSQEAGVGHLIFFSTSKVLGEFSEQPFTKTSPLNPPDAYSSAKAQAETAIQTLGGAMTVSIVRPPVVYGPGAVGNIQLLVNAVKRGIPIPVSSVPNARSMIYAGNLVEAARLLVDAGDRASGMFHPTDGRPLSSEALVKVIGEALGRKPRLVRLPGGLLEAGNAALSLAGLPYLAPLFKNFELSRDEDLDNLGWPQDTRCRLAETLVQVSPLRRVK